MPDLAAVLSAAPPNPLAHPAPPAEGACPGGVVFLAMLEGMAGGEGATAPLADTPALVAGSDEAPTPPDIGAIAVDGDSGASAPPVPLLFPITVTPIPGAVPVASPPPDPLTPPVRQPRAARDVPALQGALALPQPASTKPPPPDGALSPRLGATAEPAPACPLLPDGTTVPAATPAIAAPKSFNDPGTTLARPGPEAPVSPPGLAVAPAVPAASMPVAVPVAGQPGDVTRSPARALAVAHLMPAATPPNRPISTGATPVPTVEADVAAGAVVPESATATTTEVAGRFASGQIADPGAPDTGPARHVSGAPPAAGTGGAGAAPDAAAPQPLPAVSAAAPAHHPAATVSGSAAPPSAPIIPPPHAQITRAVEPFVPGLHRGVGAALSIRLDPADLGQVEVRIEPARDGTMRVEIVAERPETMALLHRDQHDLLRALDRAGLSASEPPSFSLAGHTGGSAGREAAERQQHGPPQGERAPARSGTSSPPATSLPAPPARPMHGTAGRIDLIA